MSALYRILQSFFYLESNQPLVDITLILCPVSGMIIEVQDANKTEYDLHTLEEIR